MIVCESKSFFWTHFFWVNHMFKKSLSFLIFIVFTSNCSQPLEQKIKVVALDCHGVLVESRPWNVYQGIIRFLWHHYDAVPLAVTLGPRLINKWLQGQRLTVSTILRDFPVLEKYHDDVYHFVKLRSFFRGTLEIIKKLKKQGVIVILASNMAQDTLDYNKKIRPTLFDLFDVHYTSIDEHGPKMEPRFYTCLMQTIHELTAEAEVAVAFIDDDQRNIDKALESGVSLDAILFTNPEQLEQKLIELGYLDK